jgi:hypothetical protein
MFQTLVTIATLIATSAHALLGCCWHHGHAHRHAECQIAQIAEQETAPHKQCACQHGCNTEKHKDAEESGQSNVALSPETAPCGHSEEHESGECEGRCQFLTNAKVELPSLDRPNLSAGLVPGMTGAVSVAISSWNLPTHALSASLLSGSLCVRDLTQVARI